MLHQRGGGTASLGPRDGIFYFFGRHLFHNGTAPLFKIPENKWRQRKIVSLLPNLLQ